MASTTPRFEDRHSYISVGLRYHHGDHWHPLRAFGWNAKGFNFHTTHEITATMLQFKRGLSPFDGSIVWRATQSDREGVLAMLINELLFQKVRAVASNKPLQARLITLIRAPLLVSEKRKVLASLGMTLDDQALLDQADQRLREQPMFRYGVSVDSDVWRRTVDDALHVSSAVASLESISSALHRQ